MARLLEKDLETCNAASPGPYHITPCTCGHSSCKQVFISITGCDGRLEMEDAQFIQAARLGWPVAIKRAMEAEEKVDQLIHEMRMLQDELNRRCVT